MSGELELERKACMGQRALPATDTPLWGTRSLPQCGLGGCWSSFFLQQVFSHMGTQLYEREVRESMVQRRRCLWVGGEKQLAAAMALAGGSKRPQDRGTWGFHLQ